VNLFSAPSFWWGKHNWSLVARLYFFFWLFSSSFKIWVLFIIITTGEDCRPQQWSTGRSRTGECSSHREGKKNWLRGSYCSRGPLTGDKEKTDFAERSTSSPIIPPLASFSSIISLSLYPGLDIYYPFIVSSRRRIGWTADLFALKRWFPPISPYIGPVCSIYEYIIDWLKNACVAHSQGPRVELPRYPLPRKYSDWLEPTRREGAGEREGGRERDRLKCNVNFSNPQTLITKNFLRRRYLNLDG